MAKSSKTGSQSRAPHSAEPRRRQLAAAVIVTATLVAYIPAMRGGFIWDDDEYVTGNQFLVQPDGLRYIWFSTRTPQYYPLVFTSFYAEYALWADSPLGYHVVNVLLHAASALLVWRIGRRIGLPACWFVALVFALHPVHVESVAWITERKNVLSGVFFLFSLDAFLTFLERRTAPRDASSTIDRDIAAGSSPAAGVPALLAINAAPESDRGSRAWRFYALSLLCFVAALLSKSVTAMLPFAIVLIVVHRRGRPRLRDLLPTVPFFIIGAAAGLHTAWLEQVKVGAQGGEFDLSLLERLLIASRAFWFYVGKLAWPDPLVFIYPRWSVNTADAFQYVPLVAALIALAGLLWLARRGSPGPLLLALYSAFTLFPALGFLNVYPHKFSFVADHFNYLGSLGFVALITGIASAALHRLRDDHRRLVQRTIASAVAVALAAITFRQGFVYRDYGTVWEHTLKHNPGAWIAMVNLGVWRMDHGRPEEGRVLFERAMTYAEARPEALADMAKLALAAGDKDAAIEFCRQAVDLRPKEALRHADLGVAYYQAGRMDEAERNLRRALELSQDSWTVFLDLSRIMAARRNHAEAVRFVCRAIELVPIAPEARTQYGNLLIVLQRPAEAAEQFRTALRYAPGNIEALFGLSVACFDAGQYADALRAARQGLSAAPDDPRLLNRLALSLAASPDPRLRDGRQALGLITDLIRRIGPEPSALDTYAAALAEAGQFDQAAVVATDAIDFARKRGDLDLIPDIERRKALYLQQKPYRHQAP